MAVRPLTELSPQENKAVETQGRHPDTAGPIVSSGANISSVVAGWQGEQSTAPVLRLSNQTNTVGDEVELELGGDTDWVAGGSAEDLDWTAAPLPTGLTVDANTGVVSGTITDAVGSPFTVSVEVEDEAGNTDTGTFTWTVNAA